MIQKQLQAQDTPKTTSAKKARNKKIAGYVEWERDWPDQIPDWCPLLNKNTKVEDAPSE